MPRCSGGDPDALDLACLGGGRADLGLEDDLAVVDAGERAAGADEFGDAGLVEEPAVAAERGDADLLGEHRHAGLSIRTSISSLRMRRTSGSGVTSAERLSVTMRGWLARTSRAGPQEGSRSRHSWVVGSAGPTMEEQRRSGAAGAVGEGADGFGSCADGDEVGAGVAQGSEHAVGVPAPHLAAEAPGVEPRDLHAGRHEGVGHGLALQDGERGAEVAGFEDPGGGLRQHEGGLTMRSADFRTVTEKALERRRSPGTGFRGRPRSTAGPGRPGLPPPRLARGPGAAGAGRRAAGGGRCVRAAETSSPRRARSPAGRRRCGETRVRRRWRPGVRRTRCRPSPSARRSSSPLR